MDPIFTGSGAAQLIKDAQVLKKHPVDYAFKIIEDVVPPALDELVKHPDMAVSWAEASLESKEALFSDISKIENNKTFNVNEAMQIAVTTVLRAASIGVTDAAFFAVSKKAPFVLPIYCSENERLRSKFNDSLITFAQYWDANRMHKFAEGKKLFTKEKTEEFYHQDTINYVSYYLGEIANSAYETGLREVQEHLKTTGSNLTLFCRKPQVHLEPFSY